LRQIRNAAMPIRVYRVVHAGAKTQLGGVKTGLLIFTYHSEIELRVNNAPTMPAL